VTEDRPGDEPELASRPPETDDSPHDEAGLDLARAIARGLAGHTGPERKARPGKRVPRASDVAFTGAHPDARDPQSLDSTLGRFVTEQGWSTELRVHGVFGRWATIVGDEVASHALPETFADGRLTVRTDSTAWATQIKLLAPDLVRRLNDVLGDGTVEVVDVRGPDAPNWVRGRYRVKGRGPRDTYG
jgi:predicted nucleic acid-binding Zn ribbon protein